MDELKSNFEEFENIDDFSNLDQNNLITEVLFKPKLVFKYLFKVAPTKYVQLLLVLSALVSTLERAFSKNVTWDSFGTGYFLSMLVFGTLFTFLLYYFSAWIMHYFGKAFLNGKATAKTFRTVLAWSSIPSTASVMFLMFLLVIYGSSALSDSFIPPSETAGIVYIIVGVIEIILAFWSLTLMVIGIKLIQNFNTWKAIGNLIIPFALIILIFVFIFFIGDII